MNNLRKIGLSALAGSLATFSVNAADMSVSGAASISFDDTNRGKGDRGNGFYMGDSLKFNAVVIQTAVLVLLFTTKLMLVLLMITTLN